MCSNVFGCSSLSIFDGHYFKLEGCKIFRGMEINMADYRLQ